MGAHPLLQARRRADFSQALLAATIGVPVRTYAEWEQGRGHPDASQAVRLSRLLRAPLTDVLWTVIEEEIVAGRIPPNRDAREAARRPLMPRQHGRVIEWMEA